MTNLNDKLASLKGKYLERDDETDEGGRIYRDKLTGQIYYSVTRILSATMPEENKKALENWLERPGSHQTRDMAAARGTATHNSAEYCLKNCSTTGPCNSHQTQQLEAWRRWPISRTKGGHEMEPGACHSKRPACSLVRQWLRPRSTWMDSGQRNRSPFH